MSEDNWPNDLPAYKPQPGMARAIAAHDALVLEYPPPCDRWMGEQEGVEL